MNAPNTGAIGQAIASILSNMPTQMLTACTNQVVASGSAQFVTPLDITGIAPGSVLAVDVLAPESVTVVSVVGGTFSAIFTKNHIGTWTIGTGPNFYTLAKLGAVVDQTDLMPYAAVTFVSGKTERFVSGWKINSTPRWKIESGFDQTNSTTAELQLCAARDLLLPFFMRNISLGSVPGVYVTLLDADDAALYKEFPNGRVYRLGWIFVKSVQQYNVAPPM
jgi:hypothetical protein